MRLRVDPAGSVSLEDAEDCAAFSIVGAAPGTDAANDALRASGIDLTDDGAHGYVDAATVTSLAAGQVADDWPERFAGMVAYARSKGWTDDAGRVRAHTEWDG